MSSDDFRVMDGQAMADTIQILNAVRENEEWDCMSDEQKAQWVHNFCIEHGHRYE